MPEPQKERSAPAEFRHLVEPGWTDSVLLRQWAADPPRLLFYPDGRIGVEHKCKVIGDTQIICAPRLQLDTGHRVVSRDPVTVEPSIGCPDCGLHGFAREGRWIPV